MNQEWERWLARLIVWLNATYPHVLHALEVSESKSRGQPISYQDLLVRPDERDILVREIFVSESFLENIPATEIPYRVQYIFRKFLLEKDTRGVLPDELSKAVVDTAVSQQDWWRYTLDEQFLRWFCVLREVVAGRPILPRDFPDRLRLG